MTTTPSANHRLCRLFRVLFQYIPLRDSPNENPQLELPLQAGDYILVHGEMDEDRFYHGETLYGQTGLVPSNYVERVSDEQLVANAAAAASRSQSPSFPLQVPAHHAQIVHDFSSHSGPATADTPLPDSVCPYPPVDVTNVKVQEIKEPNQPRLPYPRELTIEKKMSRSVVLSWSPPEDQLHPVSQYHVCVDGSVKAVVPGTYKCKALIEDVPLDKSVNVSVRAVSEQGHSFDAQCNMAVGAEAPVAPQHVRVWSITPVGACVGWFPSNSNAEHVLLLNAIKVGVCPPSVFQVQLSGLLPSTIYRVSIRTKHPKAVLEQRPVERCVDFKTLPKIGLPEPPKNVQVEAGPQPGTLLVSWTPVTSQPLPPSRAAVHSYLVFADGRNIAQVPSANADHVLLRLSDFADDPPLFITVRVRTREGNVSPDSNVVRVPRSIANLASNIATSLNSSTTQMNSLVSSMVNNQTAQQLQSLSLATNPLDLGVPSHHHPPSGLLTTMSAPSATLTRLGNAAISVGGGSGTLPLRKASAGGTLVPSYENQMLMNGGVVGSIKDLQQSTATWRQSPSTQVVTQPTSSAIAVGAAGQHQQSQYYTFHPKLLAKEFGALDDKPSVLEMENNYVLKHRQQWPSSISDATRHRLENYVRTNGRSFSAEDPMNRGPPPPPHQMVLHGAARQQFPKPLVPPRLSRVRSEEMLGTRSEPDLRPMAIDDENCRLFVALFDYAPHYMSPNPTALQDELPLRKHQVVRVYGDVDADGFYHGYNGKRFGLVPSNMVIEIAKSDLMPRRRRSDANFPATVEPTLRRMRWGSLKSRSYDHAGDRRPGPPGREPGPPSARYPMGGPEYEYYSSLDRRDHSLPPQAEPYHPREPPPPRSYYERGDNGYEPGYRVPPASARYGPPRHYHSFTSTRDRDYLSAYRDVRSARDPYEGREYPSLRRDYGPYQARAPPPDDYRPGGGEYVGGGREYGTVRRPRPPEYGRDYRDERDMMEPPREPRRYVPEVPYQDDRRGGPPPPQRPPMDYRREEDSGPSDYDRGPQQGGPPGGPPGPPAMKGPPPPQKQQQMYQDQQHTGVVDDRYAKQNGGDQIVRQMVAKFSYSSYLSPNVDADQVELQFREGDIITIFGDIDEDGFYFGELNGVRGLVPSNFLSPLDMPRGEMMYAPRQQPQVPMQAMQQMPPQQQQPMGMAGPQVQQQPPLDQAPARPRGVAFTDTAPTAKRPVPARQASQTSSKGGTAAAPATTTSKLKSGSSTGSSAGSAKPTAKKADASKATANNRKTSQAIKKTDSQLKVPYTD
ncbi:hypothetical protein QR680_015148 [Steinernema hermaphroditum]|uniref:RIMS-binding protein 2 n=1 Tax=Steinernema hermaphroditum TaxID=289476 RepID=A0AA39IDY5_9BILA|nr:hypothetical protein QR680_015148 [Steinernema hermaphroditum]